MTTMLAGRGRKKPQRNIPVERLHLDSQNPRLAEEWQGKKEDDLIKIMYEQYNLIELADSMAKNGYFDEEPLVIVPQNLPEDLRTFEDSDEEAKKRFEEFIDREETIFTVVEGNRRLATVKLLLYDEQRLYAKVSKSFPTINEEVAEDLKILPAIIYPNREEVVPYLGVRHIIGIEKWDPYPKARYLAELIESGKSIEEVQEQIGDKQNVVVKSYVAYKLLQQAKEDFDYNIKDAKNKFSLLMLAIGQINIRQFIGLPRRLRETNFDLPVSDDYVSNLENLLSWIYGDKNRSPVISDSRDITDYLKFIVTDNEASLRLSTREYSLKEAYDLTDGEEEMVKKYLIGANRQLEKVKGIVHRHQTEEILELAKNCATTANKLLSNRS